MGKSIPYVLLILAIGVLSYLYFSSDGSYTSPDINEIPLVEIETITGQKLNISNLKGKIILINFWATWCPPCREEMPYFEEIYRKYKDKGFTIIAVSVDANENFVKDFVKEYDISFPVSVDKDGLSDMYGVSSLPMSFLYDKSGKLVKKKIGAYFSLEDDLKKLLSLH